MAELTEDQLDQMLADIGLRPPVRARHGTASAYRRHLDRGEQACDDCREANRVHKREQAARARTGGDPYRRKPIAHGTPKGYRQHRYRGEQACEPCIRAERERQQTPASERPPGGDGLLTTGDVASLFGVDGVTVRRWVAAGRLTAVRTGSGHRRYRADEVQALHAEQGGAR